MSGSPLLRTGRSGESWFTPFPNLLMPLMAEGHLESELLQLHFAKRHSAQSDFF